MFNPILLVKGAYRRLRHRLRLIWVPRSPGHPPISQEVIDLILEMKRENWGWGSLRKSQEFALLGINVHKKVLARIPTVRLINFHRRIERLFLTIRNEVFDRVEVKAVSHASGLCSQYKEYYDHLRPHQALHGSVSIQDNLDAVSVQQYRFKKIKSVEGLITKFEIAT